uniref:SAP domain-containing protein n=1 Tax=Pyxicephalus adspersus TaxID=30357 RepID=A0AAV2ZZ80_PYXAD|nr:TPA: hypothetical protein GDO54_004502 [Pyxicephalus adspersus]
MTGQLGYWKNSNRQVYGELWSCNNNAVFYDVQCDFLCMTIFGQVNDLRKELESRTLSSKGLKSQLIARLTKQLRVEEQKEEQKEQEKCEKDDDEEEERKSEDDKEEEERKRQEEVERQRREKRYILPEEPAIIVHPNWSAKNGKFDCSIMSLSVLLDYRIEDNKEHSFEVSLFAELFNEMLQRDFGVRIYKELLTIPEKEEKRDKKIKKEDKKEKKDDRDDDEEPKLKRRKSSDEKRSEERDDRKRDDKKRDDYRDDEEIDEDNQEDYEPVGGEEDDGDYEDRDDDDDDSSTKDKREDKRENRYSKEWLSKDKEKEKKQMLTVNKDLLMAFVYFDQSHCGYLLEKDLEEIVYTLGLHLSRAQVKKLLTKALLKESLYYRRLTDTCTDDGSQEEMVILNDDILGNRLLLPSKISRSGVSSMEEKGGLIVYNGAMVDVGSLLQKLEKSEKARAELEQRLQALQSRTEVDEKSISQLEASNKSLSGELKEAKSDLTHLRESLKSLEDTNCQYEEQLTKTIRELSSTMQGIQTVLSKNPLASEDQKKSKENGASF